MTRFVFNAETVQFVRQMCAHAGGARHPKDVLEEVAEAFEDGESHYSLVLGDMKDGRNVMLMTLHMWASESGELIDDDKKNQGE